MRRLVAGSGVSLFFVAFAGGALAQGALRVLHTGSKEREPTGVFVRRGVLEIYGRAGRLLAWDLQAEEATSAPEPIELSRNQRLVHAALDELPALATWSRAPGEEETIVLEGRAGAQKAVRLDGTLELALALSGDGKTAAAFPVGPAVHAPGRLFVADLERGELHSLSTGPIDAVSLSATGERILVRGPQGIAVHDRSGQRRIDLGRGRAGWMSPSGGLVAVLEERGVAFFEEGRKLGALRVGPFVGDVALADGARLAAVANGARVVLFDLDAARAVAELEAPDASARFHSVDLADDGRRLAAGGVSLPDGLKTRPPVRAFVLHWLRDSHAQSTRELEVERWSIDTPDVSFLPGRHAVLVRLPYLVAIFEPEG